MFFLARPKVVFVHIQKTAGSSIRKALFHHGQATDQQNEMGSIGYWHAPASLGIKLLGHDRWCEFRSFAVVRNPWERLVSWWTMAHVQGRHHRIRRQATASFASYVYDLGSFHAFLAAGDVCYHDSDGWRWPFCPQVNYISGPDGQIVVDHILRFERLDQDWPTFCGTVGLPPTPLEVTNATPHAPYRDYYTPETRDLVAEKFAPDIAQFGYEY